MRSPLEKGEGHWAGITKCFRCIGSAHRAVSLAEDLAEHLEYMEELDVLARFHLENRHAGSQRIPDTSGCFYVLAAATLSKDGRLK